MMLLRARTLAMGFSGVRAESSSTRSWRCSTPASPPPCTSTARSGASGDLAPLAHVRAGPDRRGRVRDEAIDCAGWPRPARAGHAAGQGGARADQRHRRHARHAGARARRPRHAARAADIAAAMSVEALLGTDRAFAADLWRCARTPARPLGARNLRGCSTAARSSPATAPTTPACRTPTRCAARRRCTARPATPSPTPRDGRHRARVGDRQPERPARRPRRVVRPLPRRAGRLRLRLPGHRRRRGRRHRRAPHRPPARPHPSHGLPPFLAEDAGVNSGLMIAQYTQAAMVAENRAWPRRPASTRCRRRAMQEDHVSMGWGAARKLRRSVANLGRILACELVCAARGLDLRAPLRPAAGDRRRGGRVARRRRAGHGPDRWLSPELAAAERAGDERRAARQPSSESPRPAGLSDARRRRRERACQDHDPCGHRGHRADLPRLAAGSGAAHADEQPRPRGGRAARRSRRLRRHRPRGAIVGRVRRDRRARSTTLGDDETMLVQSGKPVGVFRTHEWAPRVLIANSNLVPEWANWDEFRRLEALGLTMYGQMTAGSWIYIGTQGILQGTYECFAEIARRKFGGTLAGTITLTAGLGGMGGAQPLAVTMNDGVALCIDVDASRVRAPGRDALPRRGRPTRSTTPSPAASRPATSERPLSVGLVGNAADVLAAAARRWTSRPTSSPTRPAPTIRSATCPPTSRRGDRRAARATTRRSSIRRARDSMATHCRAMVGFLDSGRRGLRLRQQPAHRGQARRLRPGVRLSRASCPRTSGRCSARARARSAGWRCPAIRPTSRPPTGPCSRSSPTTRALHRWIRLAGERVAFQGLPARICWLGYGERHRLGLRFNEMVRSGELSAPIVIGRDHLDSGSVASPYRETEAMADGSDAIADWPLLNALVNTAVGAHVGQHPPRRRRRHRALDPRRHGVRRRRHRPRRREARRVLTDRPRHGRHPPRRRRLRPGRRGRRRARRAHPDAARGDGDAGSHDVREIVTVGHPVLRERPAR